jgi:hypothetical protein
MTDKPSQRIPSEGWGPHYATLWEIAGILTFSTLAYEWQKRGNWARHEFLRLTWHLKQHPYTKSPQHPLQGSLRGDEGYLLQELLEDLDSRVRSNPVFHELQALEYLDRYHSMFERIRLRLVF